MKNPLETSSETSSGNVPCTYSLQNGYSPGKTLYSKLNYLPTKISSVGTPSALTLNVEAVFDWPLKVEVSISASERTCNSHLEKVSVRTALCGLIVPSKR